MTQRPRPLDGLRVLDLSRAVSGPLAGRLLADLGADVARLLDLAAACDVLVENFRPGVLDRFGAGWPALSAVNPRLGMLSISGFGRGGEDAERAAYAPVIHAEAGLIGRQADITG